MNTSSYIIRPRAVVNAQIDLNDLKPKVEFSFDLRDPNDADAEVEAKCAGLVSAWLDYRVNGGKLATDFLELIKRADDYMALRPISDIRDFRCTNIDTVIRKEAEAVNSLYVRYVFSPVPSYSLAYWCDAGSAQKVADEIKCQYIRLFNYLSGNGIKGTGVVLKYLMWCCNGSMQDANASDNEITFYKDVQRELSDVKAASLV